MSALRISRLLPLVLLLPLTVLVLAACGQSQADSKRGAKASSGGESIELLNVSYDPTRELWKEINSVFIPHYEAEHGGTLTIKQSHGGSGAQARSVIEGLDADVVTLAMWGDTDAIARTGQIDKDWPERFPNGSLPYSSTIVFVVRKGNPKHIKDWPDLVQEGIEVITPNPKTSGNGKLSFLAAWGSVVLSGGTESEAAQFVTKLYRNVPVMDLAARASTTTFAQREIGDVHLTWENEAYLEVEESGGKLEVVYPQASIRAEPRVALVDANVKRKGTRAAAEAYLNFLYTDEAQRIIAKNHYRPSKPQVLSEFSKTFPSIELFSIKKIAKDWNDADQRFFRDGAIFDQINTKK